MGLESRAVPVTAVRYGDQMSYIIDRDFSFVKSVDGNYIMNRAEATATPITLIASAIRRERGRAGLSLSALAVQAGLAKSTLSQLESGQGNPSVETLWAIANALAVPFSFLFEAQVSAVALVRANEGAAVCSDSSDLTTTLLADCPAGSRRDLYRVQLSKGASRKSKPHPAGTLEHLVVISGQLRAGPEQAAEQLGPGDYYRYPADVAHFYESLSANTVFIIVSENPR